MDILSTSWEALVFHEDGQYQAVLPLIPQKKGPFCYLEKPNLAQQLGLIYREGYGKQEHLTQAIDALSTHFSLIRYPLNYGNPSPYAGKDTDLCKLQKNHVLDLAGSYQEIKRGYRRDRKARLNQAQHSGLTISKGGQSEELLSLLRKYVADKIYGGVAQADFDKLRKIMDQGLRNRSGYFLKAQNQQGQTLSMAFFLEYHGRLTYFQCANTDEARKANANTLLLDHVIRENSGKRIILDFEGSPVKEISDFYKSFGAEEEVFYWLDVNNLPYLFRRIQAIRKFIVRGLNHFSS